MISIIYDYTIVEIAREDASIVDAGDIVFLIFIIMQVLKYHVTTDEQSAYYFEQVLRIYSRRNR